MYKARISPNIKKDQGGINHVELYAGKKIIVEQDSFGAFFGCLPKSNDKFRYYWVPENLIELEEIAQTS